MKKMVSVKALLADLNYYFFLGEMAKMSLNDCELFLLFVSSTKAEKDKRKKKKESSKASECKFLLPALILTCKFLSHGHISKMCSITTVF